MDGFFTPLENTKPYLKLAAEGFAGSGKTYTLAQLAIGLHRHIGSTKPICVFDTERAAKFLRPLFAAAEIEVLHKESRSLADLKRVFGFGETGQFDILFIDSISHVWEDFLAAYQARKNRKRLEFQDWGVIKPTLKLEFSDPYVNSPLHILMTGRAGYEYANEVNQETGKREIYKSGIKMKVEGETAYESDVLLLMERFEKVLDERKEVWRECTVIKDRSTLLDGQTFRDPTFADFQPMVDAVLGDAVTRRPGDQVSAGTLIEAEDDRREYRRQRDILCEEIQGYMTSVWPGQSAKEKRAKADALEHAFATRSWTAVQDMHPDRLREGLEQLKAFAAAEAAQEA
ncbi:MAG: AAA family ATPase [Candidatus Nanopelagicales bacterium]